MVVADPVAALIMTPIIAKEGMSLQESRVAERPVQTQ